MKGQEFDVCDLPFDDYYTSQVERKSRPWGCPLSRRYHDGKHGYGPFGRPGFDQGPGHPGFQGPDHQKFGPPEDGQRRHGWGRWGPPKREGDELPGGVLFNGPPGVRPGHDARPPDFHGYGAGSNASNNYGPQGWWFGRRGAPESAERPSSGPWGGPDHHRRD